MTRIKICGITRVEDALAAGTPLDEQVQSLERRRSPTPAEQAEISRLK